MTQKSLPTLTVLRIPTCSFVQCTLKLSWEGKCPHIVSFMQPVLAFLHFTVCILHPCLLSQVKKGTPWKCSQTGSLLHQLLIFVFPSSVGMVLFIWNQWIICLERCPAFWDMLLKQFHFCTYFLALPCLHTFTSRSIPCLKSCIHWTSWKLSLLRGGWNSLIYMQICKRTKGLRCVISQLSI